MPLPSPNLDDRRFQDFVDEAKRRIPRVLPEWTNHNVADPGIALIELFAWMSEMVLFRVNQVPDRLYTHFLDLVGIEPFPPVAARTNLTFRLSAAQAETVTVPRGTEVTTTAQAEADAATFTTNADLDISPPVMVAALTSAGGDPYADVWEDLSYSGGSVVCFPVLAPDSAFYLGFSGSLAGVLLRLDVTAAVEGIGVNPDNPPLVWEAWSGETWLPVTVGGDGTGGLNRDGAVELDVPLVHAPLTLGGRTASWIRVRLTEPLLGQPAFQASPQVRAVAASALGGTVSATHATRIPAETVGHSAGSPSQVFRVSRPPMLPREPGEAVRVVADNVGEDWTEVADFTQSREHDRHVVVDGAAGTVQFGPSVRYPDGSTRNHGAVPRDGAQIVMTGYRHGGGRAGNVGAGTLTVLRTTLPFVDSVANRFPASGGVDPETVENAKKRGPLTLRTGMRAVTGTDFEQITRESTEEVARARCLPAQAPGGPVRVLVVPRVSTGLQAQGLDDFALPDDLHATVRDHLEQRRLIGSTVSISTPFYQGVSIAVLLRARTGRPAVSVQQRALEALTRFVSPLEGGADGRGWPFDTDLNRSSLTALLEGMDDVARVEELVIYKYDLRTQRRLDPPLETLRLEPNSLFLSASHQVVVR